MIETTFKLTGSKELDRKFFQMESKAQAKLIRTAIKPIISVVHREAILKAPKRTGALAASLKVRSFKKKNIVGSRVATGKKAYYGKFPEFGTKKQKPHKFMRPALYDQREQVVSKAQDAIAEAISELSE